MGWRSRADEAGTEWGHGPSGWRARESVKGAGWWAEPTSERERRRLIGRPLDPVKPTWKATSSKPGRGGRAASGERRIPVNRRPRR